MISKWLMQETKSPSYLHIDQASLKITQFRKGKERNRPLRRAWDTGYCNPTTLIRTENVLAKCVTICCACERHLHTLMKPTLRPFKPCYHTIIQSNNKHRSSNGGHRASGQLYKCVQNDERLMA